MKKFLTDACILFITAGILFLSAGCGNKDRTPTNDTSVTASETSAEETEETVPTSGITSETAAETTVPQLPELLDYFPLTPDVFSDYAGTGNEYVPMTSYVEYVWSDMIQLVYDNGGTQIHTLYAVRDGEVRVLKNQPELYAREDLSLVPADSDGEILIKEPITVGTSWFVTGGSRTITDLHASVTTPSGTYDALEVTTIGNDTTTRDYYAPGIGFIKQAVTGAYEITQELKNRMVGTPQDRDITFYYPRMTDTDVEIVSTTIPVELYTNDNLTDILEQNFQSVPSGDLHVIMSSGTEILSMKLDPSNWIVTVDLSPEFVSEMNTGAEMECAILQCLANTVGSLYGVEKVAVTLAGQPYESGHVALGPGESLDVDYYNVVPLE